MTKIMATMIHVFVGHTKKEPNNDMLLRKIQETIAALFFIPNAKNYGTSYERRYEPSKRQRSEAHKLVELPAPQTKKSEK